MLEKSLATFFDELAAKTSAPGGGAASAVVVAIAAGLAGMVARFSEKQLGAEAEQLARRADHLRDEAAPLAQEDAEAYASYLEAVRRPHDDPGREAALAEATDRSADVPLRIAETGAGVVALADDLGERGNRTLSGDAFAARELARAAARTAANLVVVNLGNRDDDERVRRSRELARL
jgi:formiminotetrahydrofolate cyclodeaminase